MKHWECSAASHFGLGSGLIDGEPIVDIVSAYIVDNEAR